MLYSLVAVLLYLGECVRLSMQVLCQIRTFRPNWGRLTFFCKVFQLSDTAFSKRSHCYSIFSSNRGNDCWPLVHTLSPQMGETDFSLHQGSLSIALKNERGGLELVGESIETEQLALGTELIKFNSCPQVWLNTKGHLCCFVGQGHFSQPILVQIKKKPKQPKQKPTTLKYSRLWSAVVSL